MFGFWLKHIETQTENMDIVKHLEKYDSSNHHVWPSEEEGAETAKRCAPEHLLPDQASFFHSQS